MLYPSRLKFTDVLRNEEWRSVFCYKIMNTENYNYGGLLGKPSSILAFQHVPNSRVRSLILGSGNPRIRDLYLELGSGDPKTRYRFKRKFGLFQCFKAQKILKYNHNSFPKEFFRVLGSGVTNITDLYLESGSDDPETRYRFKCKYGCLQC